MIVTDLLVMLTVMANSTYDTAMGFSETRNCLGTGQDANGNITSLKNIVKVCPEAVVILMSLFRSTSLQSDLSWNI